MPCPGPAPRKWDLFMKRHKSYNKVACTGCNKSLHYFHLLDGSNYCSECCYRTSTHEHRRAYERRLTRIRKTIRATKLRLALNPHACFICKETFYADLNRKESQDNLVCSKYCHEIHIVKMRNHPELRKSCSSYCWFGVQSGLPSMRIYPIALVYFALLKAKQSKT